MNVGSYFLYFYSENSNIKFSDPINPDYTYQKMKWESDEEKGCWGLTAGVRDHSRNDFWAMYNPKALEILKFTQDQRSSSYWSWETIIFSCHSTPPTFQKSIDSPDVNTRPDNDDPQGIPVSTNPDVFLGFRYSLQLLTRHLHVQNDTSHSICLKTNKQKPLRFPSPNPSSCVSSSGNVKKFSHVLRFKILGSSSATILSLNQIWFLPIKGAFLSKFLH